jgi:hypothetical protein
VVEGWLTYHNDFYAYSFSYPPEAEIVTQGVSGFPTEELPEDMTAAEYRRQLEDTYPDNICVSSVLKAGSVHFFGSVGGRWEIC